MGFEQGISQAFEKPAETADEVIEQHAIAGGAAGIGAAWLPGAGAAVATAAMTGIVWSMYYRINTKLGIKLSKNVLKSLASAMITNIIAAAGGYLLSLLAATLLSFIPVAGTFASMTIVAAANYGIVKLSGELYCVMIGLIAETGKSPSDMSEEELKKIAEDIVQNEDIEGRLKKAKEQYSAARKSGEVTGNETIDIIDEGE